MDIEERMMMRWLAVISVLLFSVFTSDAQYREGSVYADLYDSENVASLKEHVRFLSSAMLEGRAAGSEGEKEAAEYVSRQLRDRGVDLLTSVDGDIFGIRREDGDTLTSRNVVGFVQGYDRNLRDHFIVVGARLDNLGTMTMTVDGTPQQKIFFGANGNASGLSMLIELAGMVQRNSIMFRRSVLFVAFGASNETFAGSWYFADRSFAQVGQIDAMINLDMLGTGYNGFYAYTSSNADLNSILRSLTGELQPVLPEIVAAEPYPSDHRTFYAKDIPSVMFTTGRYPEHNTEKDTESILDFDMMERELEYIYNFTLKLADHDGAISFVPGKDTDVDRKAGLSKDDVVSYYDCDQRPAFFNSADPRQFLERWVYQYVKYPAEAVRDGIQGRVMVEFIINKDGKVSDARVVRSVSPELDEEALRVVMASPKWRPGRLKGEKVRVSMTVPVEFRLERKGSKPSFGIKK